MQSVMKAFELIELFAERGTPLGLSEAARLMGMPVSTCFNLLRTMRDAGYLYEISNRKFYPTSRLLGQAEVIAEADPSRFTIRPRLEHLRDQSGETVMLTKQAGMQAVILDIVMSHQTIRYSGKVGDFRPLYNSATGKALLSALSTEERIKLVNKLKFKPVTARTLRSPNELLEDIEFGLERGWFSTHGEGVIDVVAIARPLTIAGSTYSLSVAGPEHRMEPNLNRIAVSLVTVCERIAKQMMRTSRSL